MYLVDTSVWIDYLRNQNNPAVRLFKKILNQGVSFGLTSNIYQEILQGAATKEDFEQLSTYLETQRFYHPNDPVLTYRAAAGLYFDCRKKGYTIRSTIDCLIAQLAIEYDLFLLHNDKDYISIKQVTPLLKLADLTE